jgi:DNA-binding NarL/FixJ family response regulator
VTEFTRLAYSQLATHVEPPEGAIYVPPRRLSDPWTIVIVRPSNAPATAIECALRDEFDAVLVADSSKIFESSWEWPAFGVVLVEVRPPDFAGLGIVQALKSNRASLRVVILATDPSDDLLIEAMGLDIDGLIVDAEGAHAVTGCVREVCKGRLSVDQNASRRVVRVLTHRLSALRDAMRLLSQRELDIVRLVGEGLTNKEIGARLFVTEGTIKAHLHNIFKKLQVRSRRALAAHARERGLA